MGVVLSWGRSARKHRTTRPRIRFVIEHCGLVFLQSAPAGSPLPDPRLIFLGDDEDGVPLEVMAVEVSVGHDEGLLVIHAMPMRDKYRGDYEETKQWRL